MYTIRTFIFMLFLSFWVINCTAADGTKDQSIIVKKIGSGLRLGVLVSELSTEDKQEFKTDKGAKILRVLEESAAEEIGLEEDDVIIEFAGEQIESAEQLNDIVEDIEDEKDIALVVIRAGETKTFEATLRETEGEHINIAIGKDGGNYSWSTADSGSNAVWFSDDGDEEIFVSKMPGNVTAVGVGGQSKGGFLGVSTRNLKEQMLEYFEVEHGVLVEEVVEDSPAEEAGLEAGDIITYISGRKIEDYKDLTRTINYYNPDEEIKIEFVRKGSRKNTVATLTEKKNKLFFHGDGDFPAIAPDAVAAPKIKVKPFFFNNFPKGTGRIYII